jgi:hypothetical protein
VGSRRGRSEGVELKGENKRGGGVRGYFTTLEGLVGVGEQCGNVTLPHSSPPWSISGYLGMVVCTLHRKGNMLVCT